MSASKISPRQKITQSIDEIRIWVKNHPPASLEILDSKTGKVRVHMRKQIGAASDYFRIVFFCNTSRYNDARTDDRNLPFEWPDVLLDQQLDWMDQRLEIEIAQITKPYRCTPAQREQADAEMALASRSQESGIEPVNLPPFVQLGAPSLDGVALLASTRPPQILGRLYMHRDTASADAEISRQRAEGIPSVRIAGYNIVLVFAGLFDGRAFRSPSEGLYGSTWDELADMARYYREAFIDPKPGKYRRYLITP